MGIYCRQTSSYIHTKPHLNVLEIVGGGGDLLKLLREDGHFVKGVEPSLQLYEITRKKDIDVFNGVFEDFTDTVKYDLILAFHVIEHVESPSMFMQKARSLLKDDGRVIIETPNIWHLHGNPHTGDEYVLSKDHTFIFSERTLSILSQHTGFNIKFLPPIAIENIYAEFKPCFSLKQQNINDLKDNYFEIINHIFNYRVNYNWKQRLFNNKRLVAYQLFVKRFIGERGLRIIKTLIKKTGLFKMIEKMRFQIH